jgi:hypothetical protein
MSSFTVVGDHLPTEARCSGLWSNCFLRGEEPHSGKASLEAIAMIALAMSYSRNLENHTPEQG